ncbi:hypothetical protein CC1G_14692 [Coprinopsis cinerea okayama7|uniref:Uncharacterized protein n=1 Tax=Coprinopsis cinerea (strain Okayama-7 / 130 / ATCC MYA-4618 / FGSC 9003) TaxID=240176 RepID=D6RMK6_COPC7|nr:hypothetical protein CC1G_14692 [Coprinopsis cinerea okayama7\|eukprot:XP_002911263.1 hypothetical protein CC1G_14692 [Coprinopsis cinerea okayama7\
MAMGSLIESKAGMTGSWTRERAPCEPLGARNILGTWVTIRHQRPGMTRLERKWSAWGQIEVIDGKKGTTRHQEYIHLDSVKAGGSWTCNWPRSQRQLREPTAQDLAKWFHCLKNGIQRSAVTEDFAL